MYMLFEGYQDTDKVTKGFRPSIEWMEEKYDMINQELFYGQLGKCDFNIFTAGKGSEGNTVGLFRLTGGDLCVDNYSRQIFKKPDYFFQFDKIWCTPQNFVTLCHPQILLNGNYTGTEYVFLGVLVHEMCHYYTYMNGYVPAQGHGSEFREIGSLISRRSGNYFTIERVVNADDMQFFELNDEMKAKQEKRLAAKKKKLYAVIDYHDENIRLTTTSNQLLIERICDFDKNPQSRKVVVTNDERILDAVIKNGYDCNLRSWRYWEVTGDDWLNLLDDVQKEVYINRNKVITLENKINEALRRSLLEMIDDVEAFVEITPEMNLSEYSPLEI